MHLLGWPTTENWTISSGWLGDLGVTERLSRKMLSAKPYLFANANSSDHIEKVKITITYLQYEKIFQYREYEAVT